MDIIKRNQIRINELAAGSPELTNQALALDWNELQLALEECVFNQNLSTLPDKYGPASYFPIRPENVEQEELYNRAFKHGETLIREGKTAAFTVAGGQGTRLGYDGPKGTLPVSPIKNKSLLNRVGSPPDIPITVSLGTKSHAFSYISKFR